MDIKIDDSEGTYLEYNALGGVVDLYFLAGPSPKEVAIQYSALSGLPAMMPYWGFGSHQCKYGYRDVWQVAEVVANYSAADIPLEVSSSYGMLIYQLILQDYVDGHRLHGASTTLHT